MIKKYKQLFVFFMISASSVINSRFSNLNSKPSIKNQSKQLLIKKSKRNFKNNKVVTNVTDKQGKHEDLNNLKKKTDSLIYENLTINLKSSSLFSYSIFYKKSVKNTDGSYELKTEKVNISRHSKGATISESLFQIQNLQMRMGLAGQKNTKFTYINPTFLANILKNKEKSTKNSEGYPTLNLNVGGQITAPKAVLFASSGDKDSVKVGDFKIESSSAWWAENSIVLNFAITILIMILVSLAFYPVTLKILHAITKPSEVPLGVDAVPTDANIAPHVSREVPVTPTLERQHMMISSSAPGEPSTSNSASEITPKISPKDTSTPKVSFKESSKPADASARDTSRPSSGKSTSASSSSSSSSGKSTSTSVKDSSSSTGGRVVIKTNRPFGRTRTTAGFVRSNVSNNFADYPSDSSDVPAPSSEVRRLRPNSKSRYPGNEQDFRTIPVKEKPSSSVLSANSYTDSSAATEENYWREKPVAGKTPSGKTPSVSLLGKSAPVLGSSVLDAPSFDASHALGSGKSTSDSAPSKKDLSIVTTASDSGYYSPKEDLLKQILERDFGERHPNLLKAHAKGSSVDVTGSNIINKHLKLISDNFTTMTKSEATKLYFGDYKRLETQVNVEFEGRSAPEWRYRYVDVNSVEAKNIQSMRSLYQEKRIMMPYEGREDELRSHAAVINAFFKVPRSK